MLSEENILKVLTEQVDEAIKKGNKEEINKTTDRLIRYKNVVEKNEQKKIDIENRKLDIQEKQNKLKIEYDNNVEQQRINNEFNIENRKLDIQEKQNKLKIEYDNNEFNIENRKLDIQEKQNKLKIEYDNNVEQQRINNEFNIENRKLDIEEKKNGTFYKIMTALSVVGEFLKGLGSVSQSYADIKTAKLQAQSRADAVRTITELEKDGELPYSQANKFIGKF